MKSGKSIQELAAQLEDIQSNARDFIVPTQMMKVDLHDVIAATEEKQAAEKKVEPVLTFTNGEKKSFALNTWSDRQLAQYADIPKAYYDRIKVENPSLFADNCNHGLFKQAEVARLAHTQEARMIRTYRGSIRALVSAKYRRLDCFDLLQAVGPQMIEAGLKVKSSELTDRRMYIQAVTDRIEAEIKKGDVVQYGLVISSSDVGAGSVRIEPLIFRLVCLNGMIASTAIRKFHVGRNQAEDDTYELLTDSTKDLTDAAFWAQVKDVVAASMQPERFNAEVDRLRIAANEPILNFDVPRVIELASKAVGVTNEGVKKSMVAYLANGADGAGLTRWGLANAFTHAAGMNDVNYDDSMDLQRAGAKVIELNANQWKHIAADPSAH
jgi:hypothetical protein